ncbi:MAG TPA: alpha/beta fold hydrolase [Candidatus Margulisiibacteriota bacterium]|nr:alpha/beta fold hydrolase [Candidatus Margulisiibacteriota bacterium]
MAEARIGDVRIHYTEAGSGDPLLLIMGFGMPGDAWLGSLPFMQGFRAIYFDNRGTGRSDKPDGPYTIELMADDAAGILDHLAIERAHVYGVSMGGMIAQELVLRHPQKVRSLVLGCTMCGGAHATLGDPAVIDTLIEVIQGMGRTDPQEWVDRQLPLIFPREWIAANPGIRDMLMMLAPLLPPTPPETAMRAMAGMFGWTTYDRLPQIKAPTFIVHGDQDVLIPVENAYLLHERIPGSQLHIVQGAGHGYPAQDPVGVHQLITDFFRAH